MLGIMQKDSKDMLKGNESFSVGINKDSLLSKEGSSQGFRA
jgi:hypothetical protein